MPQALLPAALLAASVFTPTVLGAGLDWTPKPVRDEVEEEFDGVRLAISKSPPYPCSRDEDVSYTYDVYPFDTCLSPNFPYDRNVMIVNPGRCKSDGKAPYLALYTTTSDCTGRHYHPSWYDPDVKDPFTYKYSYGIPICLSNLASGPDFPEMPFGMPPGDWSMVFRCTDKEEAPKAEGAAALMTISTPSAPPVDYEHYEPRHWQAGAISDTACRVPGLSIPTHLTSYPMPDTCLKLAPKRKLKIWTIPSCQGGTPARLARYRGTGCHGEPDSIEKITWQMMGTYDASTCLDMDNDEEAISYSFYCGGMNKDLPSIEDSGSSSPIVFKESEEKPRPARPARPAATSKPKKSSGGGGEWIQWVVVIPIFFIFIIILGIFFAIMYGYSAAFFTLLNRVIMFFDREGREGQIAL